MSNYIILGNYTEQGVKTIKDLESRMNATQQLMQAQGAKMTFWYLTFGQYDFIAGLEAPDAQTVARLALAIAAKGNVRTTTLQAFDRQEAAAIINSLP